MTTPLDRHREDLRVQMHASVARAMKDLEKGGEPINISRVATAAGVSRQWVYGSPFRAEIEAIRDRQRQTRSTTRPAGEAASIRSLHAQNEALRHRMAEMREENASLRAELARALGMLRS